MKADQERVGCALLVCSVAEAHEPVLGLVPGIVEAAMAEVWMA
jgi:hypothetical protein